MKAFKAMPVLAMGTLAFGLVGATVLAPVVSAEQKTASANQTLSVTINPALGFTMVDKDVTAQPDGTLTTASTGKVTSNLLKGFSVTVENNSSDTGMKQEGGTGIIPAVDDATASSTAKGWSAFFNGAHHKIGAKGTPTSVASTTQAGNKDFTVQYAVKTDNSVAEGTYKTTLLYTVTGNPNQ